MTAFPDPRRRTLLGLISLFAGGFVPIQLVTLSFGWAQYVKGVPKGPTLFPTAHEFAAGYLVWVYLPAMLALVGVILHSRGRFPSLHRRILVGLGAGLVATLALDAVRQAGVIHSWLPGDSPVMFGRMATASAAFAVFYSVGLLVHYMNGASFGLIYAFVWGKRNSARNALFWAVAWALVLELGMMTGPPMGPMVGLFGKAFAWPQLFLVTLAAHLLFGLTLGILSQHFLTDRDRSFFFSGGTGDPIEELDPGEEHVL